MASQMHMSSLTPTITQQSQSLQPLDCCKSTVSCQWLQLPYSSLVPLRATVVAPCCVTVCSSSATTAWISSASLLSCVTCQQEGTFPTVCWTQKLLAVSTANPDEALACFIFLTVCLTHAEAASTHYCHPDEALACFISELLSAQTMSGSGQD